MVGVLIRRSRIFPGPWPSSTSNTSLLAGTCADAAVSSSVTRRSSPITAGGMAAGIAIVTALKKAKSGKTEDMIAAMEGMSFDTPKGAMVFRKEDHQALQSMYHFKIKSDPAVAWGIPELVRELKIDDMQVPIQNKR